METLISNFTKQVSQSLEISANSWLSPVKRKIKSVVITGMGTAGIGGNIVSEAIASEAKYPIIINKDYSIPNFVTKNTLVIVCSYSGNTEETLVALNEAILKGCVIVCITSGGKMEELAIKKGIDVILLPKVMPSRSSISYSIIQLLFILNFYSVISADYKTNVLQAIKTIDSEEQNIMNEAKEAASFLFNKLPIIYTVTGMASVALRFCQQLNENSKTLCWYNVFPELNHNELQGWDQKNNNFALIIFRSEHDYPRTSKRIDISTEIIDDLDASIKEVYAKGNSPLERMLYLIHWGDWASFYLAELKGIDSKDIRLISYLKWELSKVKDTLLLK